MNQSDFAKVQIEQLFDVLGRIMTLNHYDNQDSGNYDPNTGVVGAGTTTTVQVKCALTNYKTMEINNDTILMGDRKALITTKDKFGDELTIEPTVGDELTGDGDKVRLVSVQKEQYSGNTVVYACQVRE